MMPICEHFGLLETESHNLFLALESSKILKNDCDILWSPIVWLSAQQLREATRTLDGTHPRPRCWYDSNASAK
jgi:hypothetical protein